MNGLGYGVGPVIGEYLTNVSWQWVFILGIPLALLSNLAIFVLLRKELKPGTATSKNMRQTYLHNTINALGVLDYGGITQLTLGTVLIILRTAWRGSTFS